MDGPCFDGLARFSETGECTFNYIMYYKATNELAYNDYLRPLWLFERNSRELLKTAGSLIVAKSGLSCDENAAVTDALATTDASAQQRTVTPIVIMSPLEGGKRYKKQICSS
ncbi:hypothetical protein MRX96_026378 [Rhipicephalus microplus]